MFLKFCCHFNYIRYKLFRKDNKYTNFELEKKLLTKLNQVKFSISLCNYFN